MLLDDFAYLSDSSKNRSNLKILNYSIGSGSLSHAYIFCGYSMDLLFNIALSFAASVNCENNGCGLCNVCKNTMKGVYENIIIVEPEGNNITIDRVTELQRFMSISAYSSGYKICIMKEADLLNREAANRLLKTLEDPPDDRSIFVLLTEELPSILPTVASRCIIFEWDLAGTGNGKAFNMDDGRLVDIIDKGIKDIFRDNNDYRDCLSLAFQVMDFLKDNFDAGDDADRRHVEMYKNTGAAKNEIKKLEDAIKAKNKRKMSKFTNLGINIVFDIITAWLEDILAVSRGASREAINMPDNFDFIVKNFRHLDSARAFGLMDIIEKNRKYLKYSIYPGLSLDNIFLQLKLLGSPD